MNTQDLNEKQSDAVTYTDDPMLILAGPGSGKTLTITKKVFKLIEDGLSPDRILALTFSEKAAGEMQDRIEQQIGVDSGITVSNVPFLLRWTHPRVLHGPGDRSGGAPGLKGTCSYMGYQTHRPIRV
ncbi:MAG: UvrD-helicase domain-containing protein [Methanosarcinaceae archaeon]